MSKAHELPSPMKGEEILKRHPVVLTCAVRSMEEGIKMSKAKAGKEVISLEILWRNSFHGRRDQNV
jgi:hypothetical protein